MLCQLALFFLDDLVFLICLWNYGFPEAKPIEDVIASVLLGFVLLFLKVLFKKKIR